MKRTFRIILLCIVLILSCLFVSCKGKAPTLKYQDGGGFRNPQTDISYYPTSPNYFSKPAGDTPYAKIKVSGGGADILLYEIAGIDPERYLVDNGYSIYAAAGAELPKLYDFPCSRVGIYDTQVSSNDGNITDADAILALKQIPLGAVAVELNTVRYYVDENTAWYDLHFMGDGVYSGIYYQLKYGVFVEDVVVIEYVEKDANGHFINLYPGIPYEITDEIDEEGRGYQVARYNFGKEILCDWSTGNCYKIENSLRPYFTSTGEQE